MVRVIQVIPILATLVLCSCKLTERNITGQYRDYFYVEHSTELQLNRDKTYRFRQQAGLVFYKGAGSWSINNDTLILINSDMSLSNGTPVPQQTFVIKGSKLLEVADNKPTGLKLKRS